MDAITNPQVTPATETVSPPSPDTSAHPAHAVLQRAYVADFTCIGQECPDTCCVGWNMQVDKPHQELYAKKAPELLSALTAIPADISTNNSGCNSEAHIMRRDPETDFCVKFTDGLCGIQKQYGSAFLGDACHFYPRITRKMGSSVIMNASLSCPEITRLVLFTDAPFALKNVTLDRLPVSLKDYLPESYPEKQASAVTEMFLRAVDESPEGEHISPEEAMLRIYTVSRSLENITPGDWPEALPFLLETAASRFLPAEQDSAAPYRLLHSLALLVSFAPQSRRKSLTDTIRTMESALSAHIDWENRGISTDGPGLSAYTDLRARWEKHAKPALDSILRRYLQAQLAIAEYPFAGFGGRISERATILAVRFATIRLALMCHIGTDGTPPDQSTTIRVVQSISRFLDHLSDPELSLIIYKDNGWLREGGISGLLNS